MNTISNCDTDNRSVSPQPSPNFGMWVQAIGSMCFMASLPMSYLPIFLSRHSPWLAIPGFLLGACYAVGYWQLLRYTVSPYSPKFRPAPRPMLWLYGTSIVFTVMFVFTFAIQALQPRDTPQSPLIPALLFAMVAGVVILFVISIVDSGGVNPFIDLVNLTFFKSKTYRQLQEERKSAVGHADPSLSSESQIVNGADSGR